MMTREQAIFFETMDDLCFQGHIEPLLFAYHDFILTNDLIKLSDIEVHSYAKNSLLKFKNLWDSDISFYKMRWNILENLDLENAQWEYLDKDEWEGLIINE